MNKKNSTSSTLLAEIRNLEKKGLSEKLLVSCSAFLSEQNPDLPISDKLEVLLYAMNAGVFLHLNSEAMNFADQYFELLPSDFRANSQALQIYSSLLFNKGEYNQVEKLLEIWKLQVFDGVSAEDDCNFLNVSASCFTIKKDFKQAAEYMQKAFHLARKSDLTMLSIQISVNLGAILNYLDRQEEALAILDNAYKQSLTCDNLSLAGHALGTLISSLVHSGNFDRAEKLARDALNNSNKASQNELRVSAALQLSKILHNKNNFEEAIVVLEKTLPELQTNVDWQLIEMYFNRLINSYEKIGDFKKALEILEVFKERNEVVLASHSEEHLTNAKKMIEISAKTREAGLLSQKNTELKTVNDNLQQALEKLKSLSGIIPICSYCRKIRNDEGYWKSLEVYLANHSKAHLSQSMCPDCEMELNREK